MLDAHQLNVFLVAAETLNFTQAAQRLHMTQPSVSQHIQALERHFEVDLFIRRGRQVELTDAGLALVPLARALVQQSILIDETMASLKGEIYGQLTVGCSTTPGKYILPGLLTRFHEVYPRVRVVCEVNPQSEALHLLAEGKNHFALTSLNGQPHPNLEFRRFTSDPVCLIVPNDHPWAAQGEIEPQALFEADFIMREETSGTYAAVREGLAGLGIPMEKLKTILTLGNSEAIALAVQGGLGVGFVSRIVVTAILPGRVSEVQVRGLDIRRDIYIGHHVRRPATAAQAAFWDFIQRMEMPVASAWVLPASLG